MLDFGFYNMDCMEGMKDFPDKYFDLAIVDPPYGGSDEYASGKRFGGQFNKYKPVINSDLAGGPLRKYGSRKAIDWDVAPGEDYFKELFRISKNQIIWGGNYFPLPPTRCFLIWKKLTITDGFSMAMAEYAWTSFNSNAKVFECAPQDPKRFHPTQKPVSLYEWILNLYAKPGDLILDTHVGSGSSLVACNNYGFKYVGFEINEEYYTKAAQRIEEAKQQTSLFMNADCEEYDEITFEDVIIHR